MAYPFDNDCIFARGKERERWWGGESLSRKKWPKRNRMKKEQDKIIESETGDLHWGRREGKEGREGTRGRRQREERTATFVSSYGATERTGDSPHSVTVFADLAGRKE